MNKMVFFSFLSATCFSGWQERKKIYLLSNVIASVAVLCAFWLFRNEWGEQRGLKVFGRRYSFVGWVQWIPCSRHLICVMSVGKKSSGRLFRSCLLWTNKFENKFMSAIGAYWYVIECIILEVLKVIWSVNFNIFRLFKILSVCSLNLAAAIFFFVFFCIFFQFIYSLF